eukprot:5235092-Ditylum_brightwellii.AAC.1
MQQELAKQMNIITDMQAQLTTSVQNIVNSGITQMRAATMTPTFPASVTAEQSLVTLTHIYQPAAHHATDQ